VNKEAEYLGDQATVNVKSQPPDILASGKFKVCVFQKTQPGRVSVCFAE
jgi:hypothetical protein